MQSDERDIIKRIKTGFKNMALDGIKKASDGDSKMGAFILASCFIDCMTGYVRGGKEDTTKTDYKNFVEKYLPSYDPERLYRDLRCRLVHNYSEGGSYVFIANIPSRHLKPWNGKTFINLEDFIRDVEHAMRLLLREIKTIDKMRRNAVDRFTQVGLLEKIWIDQVSGNLVSFPATMRK